MKLIEGIRLTPSDSIVKAKGKFDLNSEGLDGFFTIKYSYGGLYKGNLKGNEKNGFGSLLIDGGKNSKMEIRGEWQEKFIRGSVLKIDNESKEKSIGHLIFNDHKNYIMQSQCLLFNLNIFFV